MTKNKGKFGKNKTAVEPTDEFVSGVDRLAQRLRPHALRIAVVVGVVAVAVVAYSVWNWQKARAAAGATDQFLRVIDVASRPVIPEPEDKDAKAADADKAADKAKGTPAEIPTEYKSLRARSEAMLAELDHLDADYGSGKPAVEARILRASALLDLGRYDDAAVAFDKYAHDGSIEELRRVAREGIGYAYEEKARATKDAGEQQKALEQALEAFAAIQPEDKGPGRDLALYHQGRVLAMLDRRDEAVEKFEKALAVADSQLKVELEARIASLGGSGKAKPAPESEPKK